MEAGMGSCALWVPGFRVITVALDRVLDSSVKQGITRLRSGYQKVFSYKHLCILWHLENRRVGSRG